MHTNINPITAKNNPITAKKKKNKKVLNACKFSAKYMKIQMEDYSKQNVIWELIASLETS